MRRHLCSSLRLVQGAARSWCTSHGPLRPSTAAAQDWHRGSATGELHTPWAWLLPLGCRTCQTAVLKLVCGAGDVAEPQSGPGCRHLLSSATARELAWNTLQADRHLWLQSMTCSPAQPLRQQAPCHKQPPEHRAAWGTAEAHLQHLWQPWLQQHPHDQPGSDWSAPSMRANADAQHAWQQLPQPSAPSTQPMQADSVRRKRKTKMNKHKHRKRLKKLRQGRK